jgi:ComF family protein
MSYQLSPPETTRTILAPVPLHAARLKERGYNQSAELAQNLATQWRLSCLPVDVLQRTRATESQVTLDHAARQTNVTGAFGVAEPSQISGMTVVLVDDVCTTGATLDACAAALLAAGAAAVDGVTLARQV